MLRILLLSDIHFIHCEDDENEYRSLETAFVEAMDEVRDSGGLDYILICGDIANTGQEEEYEKAEEFLNDVFKRLKCDKTKTKVYVVPGNHDINRNINKQTRLSLRSTLLDTSNADEFISNVKHKEIDTLKLIYSPFRAFHMFANNYSSLDGIAEGILSESPDFYNKSFRKEVELGVIDNYIIKLHCLNSALLCDENDVNDPDNMRNDEHKLYIPKCAYNSGTSNTTVNISMMHHPHKWFYNEKKLDSEFDKKFKIQLYGHVHTQSIFQADEGKSSVRIQLGSLQPGEYGDVNRYPPVFNILKLDIDHSVMKLKVICYSWDGVQFNLNERFSDEKKINLKIKSLRTPSQKKEVKYIDANSDNLYALRYRFFKSDHIKEIIYDINAKAYDESKPEYENASIFFNLHVSKSEIIDQLSDALTKYGD